MRNTVAKQIVLVLLSLYTFIQSNDSFAQCCQYILKMNDSYGDGWNGATLNVSINNISVGIFSAANFSSIDTLDICPGDNIKLNYIAGSYEEENSYLLYDPAWNVLFQDGPNPQTGLVFTSTLNCNATSTLGSFPCNAIVIDTGQCLTTNNTGFPTTGFTANCADFQGKEVWFKVKVPASGNLSFSTQEGSLNDSGIAIWKGDPCLNIQRIACDDDNGPGYMSLIQLEQLTPNDTLYIQTFGYGGATGSYTLCVEEFQPVQLDSSELPIVMINSLGQPIVADTKINAKMDIKYNGPGTLTYVTSPSNVYSGDIGIEIRGASSSGYPQSPFNFETRDGLGANLDVPIINMPAENDWVLLSNYNDRSLLRNSLAFRLFGQMDNYSVRTHLCEVLIDSNYRGIYLLGEKIKRDNNRVNIAKLNYIDTLGDQLTGGYILQQNLWDPSNSFQSNYSPIDHPGLDVHFIYQSPNPAAMHPLQKSYIANYVDSLEDALYSTNFNNQTNGYRKYLDTKSFIDYFIVNELARNADGFKKSVFFHKDQYSNGGKLKAGPVWDFDWAWKNIYGCSIYENLDGSGWAHKNNDCPTDNNSCGWYVRLLQDTTFTEELRCRYDYYRQTILDTNAIFSYMDSVKNAVLNAQVRHFQKWQLLGSSGPAPEIGNMPLTYNAEIDTLKAWIRKRINWLDMNIPGTCLSASLSNLTTNFEVKCYPNPAKDQLNISFNSNGNSSVISIIDMMGKTIESIDLNANENQSLSLNTSLLNAGVYFVNVKAGNKQTITKVIIYK